MRIHSKSCQTWLYLVFFLSLINVMAWADPANIPSVTANEAAAMQATKHAIIVDVREDSEWQEQHIPGAMHIPLGQLTARLTELDRFKNNAIITQCRSGKRSAQALKQLKSAGFTQIYNLSGGLIAWKDAGLTTE